MLEKFKNLKIIPKIIIGIIAILFLPLTLLVLSIDFTVRNFKGKNTGKSIIGVILVLLFIPVSINFLTGFSSGFNSAATETSSAKKETNPNETVEKTTVETSTETAQPSNNKPTYTIKHGEFVEANENDDVLVVKAKIKPNLTNKMTINQNGFNVEDIIKNQGGDKFNEIQYWAVADIENGSESKVISFTLDKNLIDRVKNGSLVGNQIVANSNDLWILPSLQK